MSTPGFGFKDRKLYVFVEDRVMLLEAWPSLKAVHKLGRSPWMEFTPRFRLLFDETQGPGDSPDEPLPTGDEFLRQRRRAFGAFRANIPRPIASAVERYQARQWKLLQLMQKCPAAAELAACNPALCFALASYRTFREKFCTLEGAVIVSRRRQRDIAEWLGFPGTGAAVRILSKFGPESAGVDTLKSLRQMTRDPKMMKILSHLPRLNAGVIGLVQNPRLLSAVRPVLISEVAHCKEEDYHPHAAETLSHLLEMKRKVAPDAPTPSIHSLDCLNTLHDWVLERYLAIERKADVELPKVPVPGTPDIIPLLTARDLHEEGRIQNNCVGGYVSKVRSGSAYIYRILQPERATLEITKNSEGDWEIGQLKCRSNTAVSAATRQAVESWLDQHALSV